MVWSIMTNFSITQSFVDESFSSSNSTEILMRQFCARNFSSIECNCEESSCKRPDGRTLWPILECTHFLSTQKKTTKRRWVDKVIFQHNFISIVFDYGIIPDDVFLHYSSKSDIDDFRAPQGYQEAKKFFFPELKLDVLVDLGLLITNIIMRAYKTLVFNK